MSKLFISHIRRTTASCASFSRRSATSGRTCGSIRASCASVIRFWPEIQKAIDDVVAYAVLVSTYSLQSKWVGKELRHALEVRKQRGKEKYSVIPLSLNGTKLGVLEEFFETDARVASAGSRTAERPAASAPFPPYARSRVAVKGFDQPLTPFTFYLVSGPAIHDTHRTVLSVDSGTSLRGNGVIERPVRKEKEHGNRSGKSAP